MPITLEICVDSVHDALIAQQSGANRIELCDNLKVGGITPIRPVLLKCLHNLSIPVYPIIRPRGGNFVYSKEEIYEMVHDIEDFGKRGCKGVVLGVLKNDNTINVETTKLLVKVANTMQVTFHKAFDETPNALQSLQQVIDTGCSRILTSGLQQTALQGVNTLNVLIEAAKNDIIIMPGGNIRSNNILQIIQQTNATEVHSKATNGNEFNENDFESEIKLIKKMLIK